MKPAARRRARECAVQALYSWQVSHNSIADIEAEFLVELSAKPSADFWQEEETSSNFQLERVDLTYFRELFTGAANCAAELDIIMEPYLSRQLDELGQIERAILRVSVYELSRREDVPYKVVINEAIELAKIFGAEDSHKFINGVLDKIVPQIRKRKSQ